MEGNFLGLPTAAFASIQGVLWPSHPASIMILKGSLKSIFLGGEGLFFATLSGTGSVLLQSLPFSRMADHILRHAPSAGGSQKGEGSILGGLGRLLDGDNR